MKKNNAKSRFFTIMGLVLALAVVVGGMIVFTIYETKLKPADFTFTTPASGDGSGYYRHCYDELNENEKQIYSVILENIYNMPEKIEVPELTDGDLNKIYTAISHDNPDLFSLDVNCTMYKSGYKTFFEPTYTMTLEEYTNAKKEVDSIVTAILNKTLEFTSVYEKELYVHDYIVTHCSYTEPTQNSKCNTVYGCLVEGKASCEGYSRAFQYIMNYLNIDNRLITGESSEDGTTYIGHMWNYLVIDSQGYFVDITWDDPKGENSVLTHDYFNVTTNDILIKHRNISQTVPLCTSTKYNYFVYENALFNVGSGEQFETAFDNVVHAVMQRDYKCIELRFTDTAILEQAKNSLFNEGVVYNTFNDAGLLENKTDSKVYYSTDDKLNTISIYF